MKEILTSDLFKVASLIITNIVILQDMILYVKPELIKCSIRIGYFSKTEYLTHVLNSTRDSQQFRDILIKMINENKMKGYFYKDYFKIKVPFFEIKAGMHLSDYKYEIIKFINKNRNTDLKRNDYE